MAFDPNTSYNIINKKSSKALSIHLAGQVHGSRVVLWESLQVSNQLWHILDAGNGFYKIINNLSGLALSTLNGGSDDGTIIHIWEYLGTKPDQHWAISPASSGFVKITNQAGGDAVSCLAGGTENDTTIHLWHYLGGFDDQDWSVVPVPHYDSKASYQIINRKSGAALSVLDAGAANTSPAILFHPVDAEDQRWHVIDLGNGYYKIINNHSGRALSTRDGKPDQGTMIHIFDYLGTYPDQHWAINPVGGNFVKITNQNGGLAVSCLNAGTDDKTVIHLWPYLGNHPDQDWSLEPIAEFVDVDAGAKIADVSPYMTGLCLEDVNHQIYGGLYSQMIFGESFQEPQPYDPNALYKIVNKKVRMLSTIPSYSVLAFEGPDDGARAILAADGDEPHKKWNIIDIGDGFYEIRNNQSGKALSTLNAGFRNGTLIHAWKYLNTFPDQQWAISPGTGPVRIMNRNGRRLVSCVDGHADPGTLIHLWDYVAQPDQDWHLELEPASQVTQPNVSGMWRSLRKGTAGGSYRIETQAPFKGQQSQQMTYIDGSGEIGIENQSLNRWGMNLEDGRQYEGYIWVRTSVPTTVYLAFESKDGSVVYDEIERTAIPSIPSSTAAFSRYDFTLTPNHSDARGRFAIKLKGPGSITVGHVFLQPGDWGRLKGLPVRKDLAELMIAQGNTVLRFGGSSVKHAAYRWKNMIGPPDVRPATGGLWYPYGSNGWGIFEFLDLAESMGVVGIPAVNIDEGEMDMADFIDYVNGPSSTTFGKMRADHGHPAPYNLKYLELGNEEQINDVYAAKFQMLATKIWDRDPNIILIVGDFDYQETITNRLNFGNPPGHIHSLAGHDLILGFANGREVWVDCHVWTDDDEVTHTRYDAKVLKEVDALQSLYTQLGLRIGNQGDSYKLVVFELNARSHDMHRALANAMALNMLERLGNKIQMVTSANAMQPDDQNDNGWDQGLLFYNSHQAWGQPSYFVTQMKAKNYLPLAVQTRVSGRESVTFNVTATKSADGRTLALHVVNSIDAYRRYTFRLTGFLPQQRIAHVTTLAGPQDAVNTATVPNAIVPSEVDLPFGLAGNTITFTVQPSSFTIIRLQ